jgi:ankyrin repeat protein
MIDDIIFYVIKMGNTQHNDNSNFIEAIFNGDVNIVRNILDISTTKHELNYSHRYSIYPIHYAINLHNVDIVKLLLENNVDITVKDQEGLTPFHLAVNNGNYIIANMLLEHYKSIGENMKKLVNTQDIFGFTPLFNIKINFSLNNDILKLLLVNGAELYHSRSNINNALDLMIIQSTLDIHTMKIICEHSDNFNINTHANLFRNICLYGDPKILKFLINNGMEVDIDFFIRGFEKCNSKIISIVQIKMFAPKES